jgi:heme exporter protein D
MSWSSFDEFLHMGGYGLYVWGSYGVVLVVMVLEAVLTKRRQRRALASARDGELG